jgi:hypothetical protein
MMQKAKNNSYASEYLAQIVKIIQENEEFLRHNANEVYDEVVELINDAIDEVMLVTKKPGREKEYIERSMSFFIYHVFMPFSYAIYFDLLAGNVPACFMELRFMLESLMKCYLADLKHPEEAFFQTRLELLEQDMKQMKLSISRAMEELGEELGVANSFVALWGKLSQDWIHMKGFTDKLVSYVTEKSDMPPWALAIPMNYTEKDLGILEELRDRISQFRSLLKTTMEKYRQEYGPGTG